MKIKETLEPFVALLRELFPAFRNWRDEFHQDQKFLIFQKIEQKLHLWPYLLPRCLALVCHHLHHRGLCHVELVSRSRQGAMPLEGVNPWKKSKAWNICQNLFWKRTKLKWRLCQPQWHKQGNWYGPVTWCVKEVLHTYMLFMSKGNIKVMFLASFWVDFDGKNKDRSKGRD